MCAHHTTHIPPSDITLSFFPAALTAHMCESHHSPRVRGKPPPAWPGPAPVCINGPALIGTQNNQHGQTKTHTCMHQSGVPPKRLPPPHPRPPDMEVVHTNRHTHAMALHLPPHKQTHTHTHAVHTQAQAAHTNIDRQARSQRAVRHTGRHLTHIAHTHMQPPTCAACLLCPPAAP